jgi:hypothetical protein
MGKGIEAPEEGPAGASDLEDRGVEGMLTI